MSILERIAYFQGRRDEVPNQELARELAERDDHAGLVELVDGLSHTNQNVRSDCLKALYETGYLKPELLAPYTGHFLGLLRDKNNRLVWGAMIALATVAPLAPEELFAHRAEIESAVDAGSVITQDNGVKALAAVAAAGPAYRAELLPYLLRHLERCRPKDVALRAEAVVQAVDAAHSDAFVVLIERRMEAATPAQAARLRRVIQAAGR